MFGLKWIIAIATFVVIFAFVGAILFAYGKQMKKRITYLPTEHKGERDFHPYY